MFDLYVLVVPAADGELDGQIKQILRNRSREDLSEGPPTGTYFTSLLFVIFFRSRLFVVRCKAAIGDKSLLALLHTLQSNTMASPLTPHTMLKTSPRNFSRVSRLRCVRVGRSWTPSELIQTSVVKHR